MTEMFRPQSTAELRARRKELVDQLLPRTVRDLLDLRATERITLEDERILDEILGLDYVIGDIPSPGSAGSVPR
ncbi:hypothetical protein NYP18_14080 [Corynebacterium sp. YIM 101645]|uniref:Uncharacterized protein n=1 Tax=Corynebacterium lemuris TaxID=1859292 RepID=A0ABT2G190_9CORY|nr:hypothetical protein [Corynebacterium lemuris]MCS5480770.1 hypothetical protein [Corynebacterium lemuris]